MRSVPSIAPWLPWIKGILPNSIVLGSKAAELFFYSILDKYPPKLPLDSNLIILGGSGSSTKKFKKILFSQGFKKRELSISGKENYRLRLFREDLGFVDIYFPLLKKEVKRRGLSNENIKSKLQRKILQDPQFVEIKYLKENYAVLIPQTGKFILSCGVDIDENLQSGSNELYGAIKAFILILAMLVPNTELREDALSDLSEIRPRSLITELIRILKKCGPGSPVWEGAQKIVLENLPSLKGVDLSRWYWGFLPSLQRTLFLSREENEVK